MPPYIKLGSIPRKRHIEHRRDGGYRNEGIYYEEVVTTAGFGRAYSIGYHLRPPTRVTKIESVGQKPLEPAEELALRHHHVKSRTMPAHGDPVNGRVPLFFNDDVILSRCRPSQGQTELYRNVSADEVLFVHKGQGTVQTMFGELPFRPLDYIVIPRCTTYQLDFSPVTPPFSPPSKGGEGGVGSLDLLIIETTGSVEVPKRYLNPDGQIRLGTPYSERDFHGPTRLQTIDREQATTVMMKDGIRWSRYTLAAHPFDLVGWDGMSYPFTFNAEDFEPITGTIHQPPPIHLTFDVPGLVICTFAPRMLDTHPDAVKVPYAHSNVQADEVLYYVQGQFGSRRGVEEGSFTLHPRGIPHGPHPGTILASRSKTRTDELAVMVDTIRPLRLTKQALELDDASYPFSWME